MSLQSAHLKTTNKMIPHILYGSTKWYHMFHMARCNRFPVLISIYFRRAINIGHVNGLKNLTRASQRKLALKRHLHGRYIQSSPYVPIKKASWFPGNAEIAFNIFHAVEGRLVNSCHFNSWLKLPSPFAALLRILPTTLLTSYTNWTER